MINSGPQFLIVGFLMFVGITMTIINNGGSEFYLSRLPLRSIFLLRSMILGSIGLMLVGALAIGFNK